MESVKAQSHEDCLLMCLQNIYCGSVVYKKKDEMCEIIPKKDLEIVQLSRDENAALISRGDLCHQEFFYVSLEYYLQTFLEFCVLSFEPSVLTE